MEAADSLVFNELFCVAISYSALRQKTMRVDVCAVDNCNHEECLVSVSFCCIYSVKSKYLADVSGY